MKTQPAHAPTASLRWMTYGLTTLLTFLMIWLLGFFLSDIGDLKGPDQREVMDRHVDAALLDRTLELQGRIREMDTQIRRQQEIQQNLKRSMDNARETMEQMMGLHRLSLEQKVTPNDVEREALATAQTRFLDAQNRYETANAEISVSSQRKFELNEELRGLNEQIELQREPAKEEYRQLLRRHRLRVASFKLAFIIPIFLFAAGLVRRYREGPYAAIFLAILLASFWKVGTVMFEHFPREFFKYIAIVAAIGIVLTTLIWVLRNVSRPKLDTLLKRYREAYSSHLCPVCSYPIARGAFKNVVWTRRGPRPFPSGDKAPGMDLELPYACPSCGTGLYEKCRKCDSQRHSLLPFCERCGNEKPLVQSGPVLPENEVSK